MKYGVIGMKRLRKDGDMITEVRIYRPAYGPRTPLASAIRQGVGGTGGKVTCRRCRSVRDAFHEPDGVKPTALPGRPA